VKPITHDQYDQSIGHVDHVDAETQGVKPITHDQHDQPIDGATPRFVAAFGFHEQPEPTFVLRRIPPRPPTPSSSGWGLLTQVIRDAQPLAGGADAPFHAHLASVGAGPARTLAQTLAGRLPARARILDAGGGTGTYARALLDELPEATALLVDRPEVLALAAAHPRLTLHAADLLAPWQAPDKFDVILLVNVLHLLGADDCRTLLADLAGRLAPHGCLVVKDLDARTRTGTLFSLNMALFTERGRVHDAGAIAGWLADAGLADLRAHGAIVLEARDPTDAIRASAGAAWREVRLHPEAAPPTGRMPVTFARTFGRALALEELERSPRAALLRTHYLDGMPRAHVAQVATSEPPAATFFHEPLVWSRLPRLSAALERLDLLLTGAGAPPLERTSWTSLASLFRGSHYGGFMPFLYGTPADLALFASRISGGDVHQVIDRALAAPILHEIAHLGPQRPALENTYLDECIAGYLGVRVLPSFAYPEADSDDALYASPWLAQVGQALARAAGLTRLVAAHAGVLPWDDLLPGFAAAALRLGWEEHGRHRRPHFLGDTMRPGPWLKLVFLAAAGCPLDGHSLASLEALPWAEVPTGEETPFDREILEDALRAMCLRNHQVAGAYRVSRRVPVTVTIDSAGCRVTSPPGPDGFDPVPLSYFLSPALARRLTPHSLTVDDVDAIPALVDRLL
jgi:hypothetical protein